jgi:hypothetical protein
MDRVIKDIEHDIKKTQFYRKELLQKLDADAKIPNVDLTPHYLTLALFDGRIDGLRIAKRTVKRCQKQS